MRTLKNSGFGKSRPTAHDCPVAQSWFFTIFLSSGKFTHMHRSESDWSGLAACKILEIWFTELEIKSSPCTSRKASHGVVCCFGSLQRPKCGELLLDKSLNSFFRHLISEISVCNAMKFLRRLLQGLQRKGRNNSLLRRELPQISSTARSNAWFAFPNKF